MDEAEQSQYSAALEQWWEAEDARKLRLAQKMLLKYEKRGEEIMEVILAHDWSQTLSMPEAIDLIECSMGLDSAQGMTKREEGFLRLWLDKINPTSKDISLMFNEIINVKTTKLDILRVCTSWAEERWEAEYLRQYAEGVAMWAMRLAVKSQEGQVQLARIVGHAPPPGMGSSHSQDAEFWVNTWVAVILLDEVDNEELEEQALNILLRHGADMEQAEKSSGLTPLALACRSCEEGLWDRGQMVIEKLLTCGAQWRYLEESVSGEVWKIIQNHPVVRREALNELSRKGGGSSPTDQTRTPRLRKI